MRDAPMIDKSHAAKAKVQAKREFKKGNLSEADYKRATALADKMLASKEADSDDDRADLYVRSRYRQRDED